MPVIAMGLYIEATNVPLFSSTTAIFVVGKFCVSGKQDSHNVLARFKAQM
jgi:hypothetical protein